MTSLLLLSVLLMHNGLAMTDGVWESERTRERERERERRMGLKLT